MLAPISVAFHKDWASTVKVGTNRQISPSDQQRIREKLAKAMQEEVVKELNAGGYHLVTAPGEDVLGVEMAVVNLYVRAPANLTGQSGKDFYAVTAGEMSLVIQLTDSVSGDAIARAFDNFRATEYTNPERITRADNETEVRSAASQWAKALRNGLDRARPSTPADRFANFDSRLRPAFVWAQAACASSRAIPHRASMRSAPRLRRDGAKVQ